MMKTKLEVFEQALEEWRNAEEGNISEYETSVESGAKMRAGMEKRIEDLKQEFTNAIQ
jgi:hypothetical protein